MIYLDKFAQNYHLGCPPPSNEWQMTVYRDSLVKIYEFPGGDDPIDS